MPRNPIPPVSASTLVTDINNRLSLIEQELNNTIPKGPFPSPTINPNVNDGPQALGDIDLNNFNINNANQITTNSLIDNNNGAPYDVFTIAKDAHASELAAQASANFAAQSETNAATSATNAAASAASVSRETANGVAGLDANLEVIRLPAGAAAAGTGKVLHGDGTWGLAGKILQVTEHRWTTPDSNTTTTWAQVGGSVLSFTPLSATSTLRIFAFIFGSAYNTAGGQCGGSFRLNHAGTALGSVPTGYTLYTKASGASAVEIDVPLALQASIASGSTVARNIYAEFANFSTSTAVRCNTGSVESSLIVMEVEA